jgi:RND family efflux transporter MFP subunit
VSIGFRDGRHVRVEAFSHSADFAKKSNLLRAIGAVMDEALDQQEAVVLPAPEEGEPQLTRAHEELARLHAAGAICTVPLSINGRLMGAITLERPGDAPFDADTVALCRRIAALVGPVLEAKKEEDRWIGHKAWIAGRTQLAHLFGSGHSGLKLAALLLVAVSVFLVFAKGTYRVTADAALEGIVQRVVTAPMEGYVTESRFRAGDVVQEGAVLALLDDKELKLERLKWQSQREQRLREYSKALAAHDRAQVRVFGAQIEQAEAQMALLDQQLGRTKLLAPFDGLVVTGDFSQSLGSPVSRGEVMFEVAPLDGYRIILEVDERDISQLGVGQRGELALAGTPGETLPFTVDKITPVSSTEEGRNYFRVEAMLDEATEALRPGMEGVAKVSIDERKLAWIWTHKLIAWARLWLWSWWP